MSTEEETRANEEMLEQDRKHKLEVGKKLGVLAARIRANPGILISYDMAPKSGSRLDIMKVETIPVHYMDVDTLRTNEIPPITPDDAEMALNMLVGGIAGARVPDDMMLNYSITLQRFVDQCRKTAEPKEAEEVVRAVLTKEEQEKFNTGASEALHTLHSSIDGGSIKVTSMFESNGYVLEGDDFKSAGECTLSVTYEKLENWSKSRLTCNTCGAKGLSPEDGRMCSGCRNRTGND